jgi:hypothetical protein
MKLSLPTLYVPLCPLPSLLADDSSKSNFAIHVSGLLSALLVTSFILPLAILPTSLFAGVYFVLFVRYLGVSRDLNRIAATTVSPIFSGFQQVLEGTSPHPSLFPLLTPFIGITTIRAFSSPHFVSSLRRGSQFMRMLVRDWLVLLSPLLCRLFKVSITSVRLMGR